MNPARRKAEIDVLFDQASRLLSRAREQLGTTQEVLRGSRDQALRRRAVFGGRRWGSRS